MKLRSIFFLFLFLVIGFVAFSNDFFLLPETYFMQKGDTLNLRLLSAYQFGQGQQYKYQAAQTGRFAIYEGGKKTDLLNLGKEGATPVLAYKMNVNGLALVEMTRNTLAIDLDKTDFIAELDQEGLVKISEKVEAASQQDFREKYTSYLKTLVTVDKPNGNVYSKELGHDLEIMLLQNPFKLSYGGDVTALIKFKGKPLVNGHVDLLVKSYSGKVFPQKLNTDATGNVYFTVSREGIYMLQVNCVEASQTKDADYEKWSAAYTFAFSNNGSLPNTYHEFGFGDKH